MSNAWAESQIGFVRYQFWYTEYIHNGIVPAMQFMAKALVRLVAHTAYFFL